MTTANSPTSTKETVISKADSTKLSEYDFIVGIDASGSMGETDCPGGRSRWDYMQESVGVFVRDISKIDSDGLGCVIFGGSNISSQDGVTPANVSQFLATRSPRGSTPLAEALTACLALAGKSDKKDFIMIFTDGVPDDQAAAAKVIIEQSHKQQNDDDCTILFVQVGKDAQATAYLKNLDDNLKGAKFDIVDAKTIEEAEKFSTTVELVLAAIAD